MINKSKKIVKLLGKLIIIFIISGIAVFIVDRFFIPWASTCDSLQGISFLKKANEKVTIINKTEQVTVKEDFSISKIAENVSPAVVSIVTFSDGGSKDNQSNLLKIKSSKEIENSIKTGIVLTGDGIVMSIMSPVEEEIIQKDNNKSVSATASASHYKVLGPNGKEYDADLLIADKYSHLVFYKIDGENFPVPKFGNSDNLESGEKIILCGNASGEYQNVYSQGIVQENDRGFSLLNSELSSSESIEGAIMTSASISNRNIGGPVIDYNGDMIGIVNQIEKDGQQVGFVMPINNIKKSIDEVIKNKKIERPFLGIYYLPIDKEIAILNNLSINKGALVYSFSGQQGLAVIKNSPADEAGIKIGDIITEVGGNEINLDNPLSSVLTNYKKGDSISIKIIRDGEVKSLEVVLR